MTRPYAYSPDMREISGFGGSYEVACQAMVLAGVEWLIAHPQAEPRFAGYQNIYGLLTDDNPDAVALSRAMCEAVATQGGATGAMHQAAVTHVLAIRKLGWGGYCAQMRAEKAAEEAARSEARICE